MADGIERAMTRQVRAAWIDAGPLTMNGGAAARAFDNWLAGVRANALREAANCMQIGIGEAYSPDTWEDLRNDWHARRRYLYERADEIERTAHASCHSSQ